MLEVRAVSFDHQHAKDFAIDVPRLMSAAERASTSSRSSEELTSSPDLTERAQDFGGNFGSHRSPAGSTAVDSADVRSRDS